MDEFFFLNAAPHAMLHWFEHYGSFTLFIFLALGVFAFPLPQESLLLVAGVMMAKGELNIPAAFISACAGSIRVDRRSRQCDRRGRVLLRAA